MNTNQRHLAIGRHQMHGFSILELMIAMTLSLLLLAGVVSMFSGSRTSYETVNRLSRLQESGRFALDQIVRDIRSSGYLGCSRTVKSSTNTLNNPTNLAWNFGQMVTGFEATSATAWTPTLDASITTATGGNDVLVLRLPDRDTTSSYLTADMTTGAKDIVVASVSPAPTAGSIALLTNCEAQSVFEISSYTSATKTITHTAGTGVLSTSPGNSSGDLGYAFKANSEIIPVHTATYYVAPALSGTGNSLWRTIGANASEELVEGIDGMQVLYGVDTDNDGSVDQYSAADAVNTNGWWSNVISVRIALLVSSPDQYGGDVDNNTYNLLGTTIGPLKDYRIRQIYGSTVSLRNRAE